MATAGTEYAKDLVEGTFYQKGDPGALIGIATNVLLVERPFDKVFGVFGSGRPHALPQPK